MHWDLILCILKHFLGTHKKNKIMKADGKGYKRVLCVSEDKKECREFYLYTDKPSGKAVFSFRNSSIRQVCSYIYFQTKEQIQKLI